MMDLFQIITDRIVAELEQGTVPWQKPWSGVQGAISHTTGKRYSLLNQMLLGCHSGEFVTFKEAQREGGHIRKGEKASMIVFWKFLDSAKEMMTATSFMMQTASLLWRVCRFCDITMSSISISAKASILALQRIRRRESISLPTKPQKELPRIISIVPASG